MKNKYICLVFFMCAMAGMLWLSINVLTEDNIANINFNIIDSLYAATDQSSSKTAQSSTSTTKSNNKEENNTNYSTDMIDLLARVINGEARGEPYLGQVAVGAVIMNRVKSAEFPNTIAGVIYQKGQFSCVTDGQIDKDFEDRETIYKAAREAVNGSDPTGGALYFYDPRYTKSEYLFSLTTITTIGNHRFAIEE